MILSIETSAEPASVSLQLEDGTTSTRSFPNNNQVNVPLAKELKSLIGEHDLTPSIILVGAGPGSYSGARVGLATAEAFAITHKCPIVTLPSFYGIDTAPTKTTLVGDARRGAYFIISHEEHFSMKILTEKEFKDSYQELPDTQDITSFEPPTKLPLEEEEQANITTMTSSSEHLIRHWNSLSSAKQADLIKQPKEVIYLRPPHITKAKSPF